MNTILTIAETIYINGVEYCRLLAQAIDTKEKETNFLNRAKEGTAKKIDAGNYTDSISVYRSPKNSTTPTAEKYKIAFN